MWSIEQVWSSSGLNHRLLRLREGLYVYTGGGETGGGTASGASSAGSSGRDRQMLPQRGRSCSTAAARWEQGGRCRGWKEGGPGTGASSDHREKRLGREEVKNATVIFWLLSLPWTLLLPPSFLPNCKYCLSAAPSHSCQSLFNNHACCYTVIYHSFVVLSLPVLFLSWGRGGGPCIHLCICLGFGIWIGNSTFKLRWIIHLSLYIHPLNFINVVSDSIIRIGSKCSAERVYRSEFWQIKTVLFLIFECNELRNCNGISQLFQSIWTSKFWHHLWGHLLSTAACAGQFMNRLPSGTHIYIYIYWEREKKKGL